MFPGPQSKPATGAPDETGGRMVRFAMPPILVITRKVSERKALA